MNKIISDSKSDSANQKGSGPRLRFKITKLPHAFLIMQTEQFLVTRELAEHVGDRMSMLVTAFLCWCPNRHHHLIAAINNFVQHPSTTSMLLQRDWQRCKNCFISAKYYGDIERAYWRPLTYSSRTSSQSSVYWEWWPSKVNWGHLDLQWLGYSNSFEFGFDESSNFCGRLNYRGSFKSDLFAEMRLSASEKFHPHPNFKKTSKIKETKLTIESVNDTLWETFKPQKWAFRIQQIDFSI